MRAISWVHKPKLPCLIRITSTSQIVLKSSHKNNFYRWTVPVPYEIHEQYGRIERNNIEKVFREYSRRTCIQFEPKNATSDIYVYVNRGNGLESLQ